MPLSPATRRLVAEDWTHENLSALQQAIRSAYTDATELCDVHKHPIFSTPNRPLIAGSIRWVAIDHHLRLAVERGWLKGISAEWVVLGGKKAEFPCHLVLTGANTSVIALHLQDENEVPRDSKYRKNTRIANEACPLLEGFSDPYEEPDVESRINLLLVHGDKNAEFAELRAYYSVEDQSQYELVIGDIMKVTPTTLDSISVDAEEVAEPSVALLKGIEKPAVGIAGV